MNINSELDKITKDYELNTLNNGVIIENKNLNILKKYDIDPNRYIDLNSLIFAIELILNDCDLSDEEYDELNMVCESLSEKNYYLYTNK